MADASAKETAALSKKEMKDFSSTVQKGLKAYTELPPKLLKRIGQFLIDGQDETCLLEMDAAYSKQGRKQFFNESYGQVIPKDRVEGKRMSALLTLEKVSPGYYRRLGEIASRIPEMARLNLKPNALLPDWFNRLMLLWSVLKRDNVRSYRQAAGEEFKVASWFDELEKEQKEKAIESVVNQEVNDYWNVARLLGSASDWKAMLADHSDAIAHAFDSGNATSREAGLNWLEGQEFDFTPVLKSVAGMAVGTSKKLRPVARKVLRNYLSDSNAIIVDLLHNGKAGERGFAAEAVAELYPEDAAGILEEAAKTEKSKRVLQTIELQLAGCSGASTGGEDVEEINLPPIEVPTGVLPLPPGSAEAIKAQIGLAFDKLEEQYVKDKANYKVGDRSGYHRKPQQPKRMPDKEINGVIAFVEGRTDEMFSLVPSAVRALSILPDWSTWEGFKLDQLHLVHVVRFMFVMRIFQVQHGGFYSHSESWLNSHRATLDAPYGLRELDATMAATLSEVEEGKVAESYLQMNTAWRKFLDWEPDAVWPLFQQCSNLLRDSILGVAFESGYYAGEARVTALKIVSMMPSPSPKILNAIWSIALGEGKTDRDLARRAVLGGPDGLQRSLLALTDGKQAIRIAASEMLSAIGDQSAIEPLKKALKKEKQELVKGALLQAIENLGGDVEEFLGRRKQLLDAKKGLEKKRPKGMEWVPLDSLPKVRWQEDDKAVADEIVQWWVVQSIQFKTPICGAILKRSSAMCRPDDMAGLAKHLLSIWTAHDTEGPSHEDALAEATDHVNAYWAPNGWLANRYGTKEKAVDALVAEHMMKFKQSAIGQKGLLAVVAAGGDREAVSMIERYVRKYHGHRLAQSKVLLEVAGQIDDTSAVQLLLSLGNRFRTKGIRKRADELVNELAERQGWTMDQLSDRTIPDAGFAREKDENDKPIGERAELVVDYGSRKFSIILGDDLQAVITRDDGKQVKALPAAAKADDADMVKVAKKEFSAAKKIVKEVVKTQRVRLYEAACLQRAWPADQWQLYLASHPIAGALCRRVVWAAQSADEDHDEEAELTSPRRLFRPLEDGSLTDVNDEEFTLSSTDWVTVAHSSLLDDKTTDAWKQHLEDYEVPELFQQFGRTTYRLPDGKQGESEVGDFKGHVLTTFQLRSKATKLGWIRGDAEDGGAFYLYRKSFRSRQIEAVVEFSGSYLPEEDISAAIFNLYFIPLKPGDYQAVYSWNPDKTKLGKVPAVLLSECYNDVKDIASVGSGFDPEWEKKGL